MHISGTIFYLHPENELAAAIVFLSQNDGRRCLHPDGKSTATLACLRIGIDQKLKNAPYLARFGRCSHNDVILPKQFSRNDQCYFDFNKETGELVLHDLSKMQDTELYSVGQDGGKQRAYMHGKPRQCVVVLDPDPYRDPDNRLGYDRVWIFTIGRAEFQLIPARDEKADAGLKEAKLVFANQADSEKTVDFTLDRLGTLGLQSLHSQASSTICPSVIGPHMTHRHFRPCQEDGFIRYEKLRPLGGGGQGTVHKVVDLHNGDHYACKIIPVRAAIPHLGIHSEREFRTRMQKEVSMVQMLRHDNIVPYIRAQGFRSGDTIEIFMHEYEGSLHELLKQERGGQPKKPLRTLTDGMLGGILEALDYLHTREPPVIHRDIKPGNILIKGGRFHLADFGISKHIDSSRTVTGTLWYMAPEVMDQHNQTPKLDMYSLGATIVESLIGFPDEGERPRKNWRQYLQSQLSIHAPEYASMLADSPSRRPTARDVLDSFFCLTSDTPDGTPALTVAQSDRGLRDMTAKHSDSSSPLTPMDWTRTPIAIRPPRALRSGHRRNAPLSNISSNGPTLRPRPEHNSQATALWRRGPLPSGPKAAPQPRRISKPNPRGKRNQRRPGTTGIMRALECT